jgi:hypothetical protein
MGFCYYHRPNRYKEAARAKGTIDDEIVAGGRRNRGSGLLNGACFGDCDRIAHSPPDYFIELA